MATLHLAGQQAGSEYVRAPLVQLDKAIKRYRAARGAGLVTAVDGVSLDVTRGESVGLVGESGCGKTTIARLIVGMERCDRGYVRVAGYDRSTLGRFAAKEVCRKVQLIFQDPYAALDPRMPIGTSLAAPLAAHGIGSPAQRPEIIAEALRAVRLEAGIARRFPRECSGGQLQRVVIARALLLKPEILICDEPTSALDASIRGQILDLLMELRRSHALTLLMISHDLRVVRYMCERVAVMYLGQIIEMGSSRDIFEAPRHPYTQALVAASMIDRRGLYGPGAQLEGEPASPLSMPTGCRFHPRCRHCCDDCVAAAPTLEPDTRGGYTRCHLREATIPQEASPPKPR